MRNISSQNDLSVLLQSKAGHVHFIGVCGVGMAGLAVMIRGRGFKVTGCDVAANENLVSMLAGHGVKVELKHNPEHLEAGVDWVIKSSAVSSGVDEVLHADRLGLPVFARGAVLAEIIRDEKSVAVGGTHGKTTTTAFVVQLLQQSGRDPSWCTGSEPGGGGGAGIGSGPIIVEADESDGTIASYKPDIAVVTNIEMDHMEHFHDEASLESCFLDFTAGATRKIVFGADDARTWALFNGRRNSVSYGFSERADIRCVDLAVTPDSLSFDLVRQGERLGRIDLPVTGEHNAFNATGAAVAAMELGLTFEEIRRAFRAVSLPRRRFERVAEHGGIIVISDYAHHPSEISALVHAAQRLKHKRIIAVFQPHRYSRTLALRTQFPCAFNGVDELILTPVYAASEKQMPGGMVWDLYSEFRKHERDKSDGADQGDRCTCTGLSRVHCARSLCEAWAYIRRELREGDMLLLVGAGDVNRIGEWARIENCGAQAAEEREKLESDKIWQGMDSIIRFNEPLSVKTTLKVGGVADVWVQAGSISDLMILLKWARERRVPFNLFGAGSNMLVSDLGVRGITARLDGGEFNNIREENGVILVGAGLSVANLLSWLTEKGWAGLEFLEGIPGSLGGCLRMNAGAFGGVLGEHVEWIRCLNKDGESSIVYGSAMGFGYRKCSSLVNMIAVEAGLKLERGDKVEIKQRRAEMGKRRQWMRGFRSAGSVFKNPETGESAGRLIEGAGWKGHRVGYAFVCERHANIIVVENGASASDVMALQEMIRADIFNRTGIYLESEIVFMGMDDIDFVTNTGKIT